MEAYLYRQDRLADVIAAIQAMATYKIYKLTTEEWAERISGDRSKAGHWRQVFEDHQEFFRFDTQRTKVSLVWRRQYPRNYDSVLEKHLDASELAAIPTVDLASISRGPLAPGDIKTLIDTAISLHTRAMETQREGRWWVPLAGAVGGLIGSLVGAAIKG